MRVYSQPSLPRAFFIITAAGALVVASAATAPAAAQTLFRAEVAVVPLQVTVVDEQGRSVRTLRLADFAVVADGISRLVHLFGNDDRPTDVLLLVDTSDSMIGAVSLMQQMAVQLVRRLDTRARSHRIGVILFNQSVRVALPLTSDLAATTRVLTKLPTGGGTLLYDALNLAFLELARARRDHGSSRRAAIVLMTDGEDSASRLALGDLLTRVTAASTSGIALYTVATTTGALPGGERRATAADVLARLVASAGGLALTLQQRSDIVTVRDLLTQELNHRYWLAYSASALEPEPAQISVQVVTDPRLRARARRVAPQVSRPHPQRDR